MVTTWFSRANIAACAGGIVFFTLYLPYPFVKLWTHRFNIHAKGVVSLISNVAFGLGAFHVVALIYGKPKHLTDHFYINIGSLFTDFMYDACFNSKQGTNVSDRKNYVWHIYRSHIWISRSELRLHGYTDDSLFIVVIRISIICKSMIEKLK